MPKDVYHIHSNFCDKHTNCRHWDSVVRLGANALVLGMHLFRQSYPYIVI